MSYHVVGERFLRKLIMTFATVLWLCSCTWTQIEGAFADKDRHDRCRAGDPIACIAEKCVEGDEGACSALRAAAAGGVRRTPRQSVQVSTDSADVSITVQSGDACAPPSEHEHVYPMDSDGTIICHNKDRGGEEQYEYYPKGAVWIRYCYATCVIETCHTTKAVKVTEVPLEKVPSEWRKRWRR